MLSGFYVVLFGDFGYDCLCLLISVCFGDLIVLVNFFCFCGELAYLLIGLLFCLLYVGLLFACALLFWFV